ncbi:MAG: peroxidase family protein, partial [Actinomycetes bacterium]
PAAVAAAIETADVLYGATGYVTENSVNATNGTVTPVLSIPNITADYNVSAGYDSWFTLFGQFFDHGLDLIPKAGAAVFIPLIADDPLYVQGSRTNFMVLTRAADATTGESINLTSPWIDQSQTYGSHPSQNVFVREYNFGNSSSTRAIPTGALLDDPAGGMPTWKTVKAQSLKLGINLSDYDVNSVPVIATNQYGKFIPGANGYALMLFTNSLKNSFVWMEGTSAGLATSITFSGATWTAVGSGHPFLNDTAAAAVPYGIGQCSNVRLNADADSIINSAASAPNCSTYDDEQLDAHLIAGDGRINENIGLSAVHNVFHGEHNLLVKDIEDLLLKSPVIPAAFKAEWTGERKYQAARFIMEMEYQHMVYDEFARRIAPELPPFITYDPSVNAQITAEFASAVYRLGHSMLNETIARSNPGQFYDPSNNQDVSLITAFTNPAQGRLVRPAVIASATVSGSSIVYTLQANEKAPLAGSIVTITNLTDPKYNVKDAVVDSITTGSPQTFTVKKQFSGGASAVSVSPFPTVATTSKTAGDSTNIAVVTISDPGSNPYSFTALEAAAAIAQGMTSQRGNEIDEFVTDGVRNNLLGLPLDLAALNITRGRDVGVPTLNNFRANSANGKLQPYASWYSFIINGLRHRESGVNFVAAYGTDPTITSVPAVADKRAAAMAIVSAAIPVFITNAVS